MLPKSNRQAYTGIPLKDGEVLVPMIADENFIRVNRIGNDKLRVWNEAGVQYKVAFYPVAEDEVESAMEEYRWNINELLESRLGRNRNSPCMIPQMDGSLKPCPKKRGDNRVACKDCPNRGLYEKEDRSDISLDELVDDYELCPAAPDDTEEEAILPIILENLMEDLKKEDERAYTALKLLAEESEENDIIAELMEKYGLKKSRCYSIKKDALKALHGRLES